MRRLPRTGRAFQSAAAYGVGVVCALLTMGILARSEGGAVLPSYNLSLAAVVIGSQFLTAGIPIGVMRRFRETLDVGRTVATAGRIARRYQVIAIAALFVGAGLRISIGDSRLDHLVLVGPMLLMVSNKALVASASVLQRPEAVGVVSMVRFAVHLGGSLPLLRVSEGFEVLGVSSVLMCGELAALGYLTRVTSFNSPDRVHDGLGTLVRASLPLWPSVLVIDVNTRIDLLFLGFLGRPEDVVVYGVFVLLADGLLSLFMLRRAEAEPLVAAARRSKDDLLPALAHMRSTRLSQPLITALAFGLAVVVAPLWAPVLLGRTLNLEQLIALSALGGGTMVASSGVPYAFCRGIIGDVAGQNRMYLIALGANIGLNLTLIPVLGPVGAAIGTAVGNVAYFTNRSWTSRHLATLCPPVTAAEGDNR